MRLKNGLMLVMVAFAFACSSTGRADTPTCDELLTECAVVVEQQQETIQLKEKQIKIQEKIIKETDKRVEELEKESANIRSIAIGEALLLLLILL